MVEAVCHSLIAAAVVCERTRLVWNTWWFETGPFQARMSTSPRRGVHVMTPTGTVVDAMLGWLHPLAVHLTVLANRGLPPLGPDEGFLARLYE